MTDNRRGFDPDNLSTSDPRLIDIAANLAARQAPNDPAGPFTVTATTITAPLTDPENVAVMIAVTVAVTTALADSGDPAPAADLRRLLAHQLDNGCREGFVVTDDRVYHYKAETT
jgi:hypothetical protein